MWKNYLTTTLRTIRRQPGYAFINVFGLAVGLASCLLILLFVRDELRYDRFHPEADRLYRVALERSYPERTASYAIAPMPVARTLQQDYPEVEVATQVTTTLPMAVRYEDKAFQERGILFADSSFFEVFGLVPLEGNPAQLLAVPNTIVLTPAMAQKYFGNADPVGKQLTLDLGTFTVTGVVPPMPEHSHFHYDFLAALNLPWLDENDWLDLATTPYIRLAEGADPAALEAKLPAMVRRYAGVQIQADLGISLDAYRAAGNGYRYFLQPITDIHLKSHLEYELEPNGDIAYVYLFSVVALIILVIACVNFMNLATARAFKRAREVGVRKALGSQRRQLVSQFLTESVLVSTVALGCAVVLAALLLPFFNQLTGKALSLGVFGRGWFIGSMAGLALIVGLLAGSYPALFLSAFRPIDVLKGRMQGQAGRADVRHALVVFQFALSIALIIGTGIVFQQMQYVFNKNLGFETERRVVIERAGSLDDRQYTFMQALRDHPKVVQASRSNGIPGYNFAGITLVPADPPQTPLTGRFIYADDTYLETFGIELVAGRPFSRERASDSLAIIINETMAQGFGWDDPVGRQVTIPGDRRGSEALYTIVGVMQDFHHESLHTPIGPVALRHDQGPRFPLVTVRLAPGDVPGTLGHIERTWQQFVPGQPFSSFFFDQHYDTLYASEERTSRLFSGFAILSVLLACMGLFGLSAFAAAQRTKEIGIRKVLGASVSGLVVLLTKTYLVLIGIAFVVAAPVAYLTMSQWLDGFAYRIDLGPGLFVTAGILALVIALLTVSWQAIRAALADPVKSLRYE